MQRKMTPRTYNARDFFDFVKPGEIIRVGLELGYTVERLEEKTGGTHYAVVATKDPSPKKQLRRPVGYYIASGDTKRVGLTYGDEFLEVPRKFIKFVDDRGGHRYRFKKKKVKKSKKRPKQKK